MSISTLGGGLAAFVMPPLIAVLVHAGGWRLAWMSLAVLALALSTLPAALLRRQPEDLGLHPDGDSEVRWAEATSRARRAENPSFTLAEALGTSTFWVLMLGVSIGGLTGNGIPATLAAIFVDRGITFQAAGAALMWYGMASIGTKVVWGWIANRQDIRRVLPLLTAYGMIALPSILFIPARAGSASLGYGLLVGMFIGANVPL